jgi:hypothetical protein
MTFHTETVEKHKNANRIVNASLLATNKDSFRDGEIVLNGE